MRAYVLASIVLAVGCGSSVAATADNPDGGAGAETGGEAGSAIGRDKACTDAIKSLCGQYGKCLPLFIRVGYGDEKTCNERLSPACLASFDAPGTSSTPEHVEGCATALATVTSCDALNTTSACTPAAGALADGSGCTDDAQCRSTWCPKNDEALCGKCTALTKAGDACVALGKKADGSADVKCSRGLGCNGSTCVKAVARGESCSSTQPCAISLACFGGKCVDAGKAGSKCDAMGMSDPPCDFLQGLYCSFDKVCKTFGYSKAGESCGLVGTEYKLCTAGAKCSADGLTLGTCVAPAKDGGACDPSKKVGCLPPAQCDGGTCKFPTATGCK